MVRAHRSGEPVVRHRGRSIPVTGPEIVTKGWVHATEAEALLGEARDAVRAAVEETTQQGGTDFEAVRRSARRALGRFINERTRRRPAVIPVVLEV